MSEELRTEELLTNEGHTETMADYEDHFDDANPWNRVLEYMEKKTILPVKIEGIVNGGAIAMVEGLRGFIPASKLSLSYIEDLETYLLKDVEVQVIDVDQAGNRLVLSARELLKEKERKKRKRSTDRKYPNRYGYVRYCRDITELRCICQTGKRSFRTGTCFSDFSKTRQESCSCFECRR